MQPLTYTKLNFNIPLELSNTDNPNIKWKLLGKFSDSYFCFSAIRARLINIEEYSGDGIITTVNNKGGNSKLLKLLNVLKVISWITVFIPIIMIISKIAFRAINNFQEVHKTDTYILEKLISVIQKDKTVKKVLDDSDLGTFSDGSEDWTICSIASEAVTLKLIGWFSDEVILLNPEQSKQLYDVLKSKITPDS